MTLPEESKTPWSHMKSMRRTITLFAALATILAVSLRARTFLGGKQRSRDCRYHRTRRFHSQLGAIWLKSDKRSTRLSVPALLSGMPQLKVWYGYLLRPMRRGGGNGSGRAQAIWAGRVRAEMRLARLPQRQTWWLEPWCSMAIGRRCVRKLIQIGDLCELRAFDGLHSPLGGG
jgi:hypothetical protein